MVASFAAAAEPVGTLPRVGFLDFGRAPSADVIATHELNLKAAKALGPTIPQSVVGRADEAVQ